MVKFKTDLEVFVLYKKTNERLKNNKKMHHMAYFDCNRWENVLKTKLSFWLMSIK